MFKNILRVGAEISILSKIGPGSLKGLNPAAGTEKKGDMSLCLEIVVPAIFSGLNHSYSSRGLSENKVSIELMSYHHFFPMKN